MKPFLESFNVHDIIKFQLCNSGLKGFFTSLNPEYEYFKTNDNIEPDFRITVTKQIPKFKTKKGKKHIFRKCYEKWEVCIIEYDNGYIDLFIKPKLKGVRKLFSYTAIKNIYVRSLIYYCLIKKGGTLIHSSGVRIDGKSYLFVGRPGMFKTSILLDALRKKNAAFIGEENVIIHNRCLYAFPFHIRSLDFRLKHYKTEEPPTFLHRIIQVLYLFTQRSIHMNICSNSSVSKVFYLEKGKSFKSEESSLFSLTPKFIDNEIKELNIKCNPRLSAGIKDNHFTDYLIYTEQTEAIKNLLTDIFKKMFESVNLRLVRIPNEYRIELIDNILNEK